MKKYIKSSISDTVQFLQSLLDEGYTIEPNLSNPERGVYAFVNDGYTNIMTVPDFQDPEVQNMLAQFEDMGLGEDFYYDLLFNSKQTRGQKITASEFDGDSLDEQYLNELLEEDEYRERYGKTWEQLDLEYEVKEAQKFADYHGTTMVVLKYPSYRNYQWEYCYLLAQDYYDEQDSTWADAEVVKIIYPNDTISSSKKFKRLNRYISSAEKYYNEWDRDFYNQIKDTPKPEFDSRGNKYSRGYWDVYFGETSSDKWGDIISETLKGKKISKRSDWGYRPGGLEYEADQLGMEDLYELLEALEGMCYEGRAREIDDSTYLVL